MEEKYNVSTAPSAQKMFCLLENNRPDLILLDIDIPEMSDYEAIKALKTKPETKDIPVIFLTARKEPDEFCVFRDSYNQLNNPFKLHPISSRNISYNYH